VRHRQNGWVLALFVAYVIAVGALILAVPRLSSAVVPPGPWDFWWVFLVLTPHTAAAALWLGVRSGWFSRWTVVAFWLAAVALGAFLQFASSYLHSYAK
jgi:hypothetical protein